MNYVMKFNGEWVVTVTPELNGEIREDLTIEECVENGIYPLDFNLDSVAGYDQRIHNIEQRDINEWDFGEKSVRVEYSVTEKTLEEIKEQAMSNMNRSFQKAAMALKEDYPETETETWPTQRDEVIAWRNSNVADTPMLHAIATSRGIDILDLIESVGDKMDAHSAAVGRLLGLRQKYRDDIDGATTVAGAVAAMDAIDLS